MGRNIWTKRCFILTMWYVNKTFTELHTMGCMCFILTMWYVNKLIIVTGLPGAGVLY